MVGKMVATTSYSTLSAKVKKDMMIISGICKNTCSFSSCN